MHIKNRAGKLVNCPDCSSTDVRYSNSLHVLDLFMWLRKRHSLRCRSCRALFYAETDEAKNKLW